MKFHKIMLIDDDADDCIFFKYAVKKLDEVVVVEVASNGIEGLNALKAQLGNLPDCIVLDINMPVMDGFECLRQLKSDENLKKIPVIVLSTSSDPADRERILEMGAESFIVKPPTIEELITELRKIL